MLFPDRTKPGSPGFFVPAICHPVFAGKKNTCHWQV